jgi:hypothetical protein
VPGTWAGAGTRIAEARLSGCHCSQVQFGSSCPFVQGQSRALALPLDLRSHCRVRVLFVEKHDSFSLNVVESRFDTVPHFRLPASSSMMGSCLP